MLRDMLRLEGHPVGRKRISTLMDRMGIEAIYKKPNTSRRHPAHTVFPYLLRNLEITHANHVWAGDITYVPMKRGFVYLFAVLDWASRKVLSWRISNTMTTDFCLEAVQEAAKTRTGSIGDESGYPPRHSPRLEKKPAIAPWITLQPQEST